MAAGKIVSLEAYRDRRAQEALAVEREIQNDGAWLKERERQHLELADMVNTGVRLQERGQYKAAEHCFRAVIAADPDNVLARFNLAVVLDESQLFKQSMVAYRALIKREPNFADAHFNLARLLEMQGDKMGAIRHLAIYRKLEADAK